MLALAGSPANLDGSPEVRVVRVDDIELGVDGGNGVGSEQKAVAVVARIYAKAVEKEREARNPLEDDIEIHRIRQGICPRSSDHDVA